jgi:predicted esterase
MSRLIEFAPARGSQQEAVVFLHGLGGDPLGTWTSGGDMPAVWPKWLADDIEGLAVWLVDMRRRCRGGAAQRCISPTAHPMCFI